MTFKVWTRLIAVNVLQEPIAHLKEWIHLRHVQWVVSVQKDHKIISYVQQGLIILILAQQTLETVQLVMLVVIVLTWDKQLWTM